MYLSGSVAPIAIHYLKLHLLVFIPIKNLEIWFSFWSSKNQEFIMDLFDTSLTLAHACTSFHVLWIPLAPYLPSLLRFRHNLCIVHLPITKISQCRLLCRQISRYNIFCVSSNCFHLFAPLFPEAHQTQNQGEIYIANPCYCLILF